ncbi:MAG: hypothetical protein K2K60_01405 [Clostridia bacterium]|nr:hypothetical protein [Clostridia bacterium]
MRKFWQKIKPSSRKFKPLIIALVCLVVCICVPCVAKKNKGGAAASADKTVLTIWQIDSFEGGKGSRAGFLQKCGDEFSQSGGCYVSVVSISAEAARLNLAKGTVPDLISYGAGTYGLESFITDYTVWCYGGYCILTLDANSDFSDISNDNTVVNEGKDNLSSAAALACGVSGAKYGKTTGAYVTLINGGCKYLLGTQRDIYRLKTRGVSFAVKPVTQFNDLYQCISVVSKSANAERANSFIKFLSGKGAEINSLGMLSSAKNLYDDEMRIMEGVNYDSKLTSPVSENTLNSIKKAISDGDINMLKNLLK